MPHGELFLHPNCHVCIARVFADSALDVLEHAYARWAAQVAANPNAIPTTSVAINTTDAVCAADVAVAAGAAAGAVVGAGAAILVVDWRSLQGFC